MISADLEALRARLKRERGLTLSIRAIPKSRATEWVGQLQDGAWKIKVAAVPERGKANEELVRFLAREFGVTRQQVQLMGGASGRSKIFRIVV